MARRAFEHKEVRRSGGERSSSVGDERMPIPVFVSPHESLPEARKKHEAEATGSEIVMVS